ncbi:MAG: YkvA family protein [Clostridium sp.]
MRISSVKIDISNEDILSIINEFVNVEPLKINEVIINQNITIKGKFESKIEINFEIVLEISEVKEKELALKVSKVKLSKIGIFRPIRSFLLKKGFQLINLDGLYSEKDKVIINLNKLLKDITFFDFNLADVYVKKNEVKVEIQDIKISIKGEIIKALEEEEIKEEVEENIPINKIEDSYNKGRKVIKEKIPKNIRGVSDYLLIIPDLITLIYRLLKDNRVSIKTKLIISASLAYTCFPSDLIPDKIPFIGKIDDIAVIFFALSKIATDVPPNIILENWAGDDDLIESLKVGLGFVKDIFGAENVEKIYNLIEELKTL